MVACFFFKQKTAYEMRISDWSSDVCSSDLGLDAEPALAGAPEESRRDRIEPIDRKPIGREAAETRPAMLDSLDLPVDDLLETIDREGDVDFLGSAVAGRAGRLVMGAQPKATAGLGQIGRSHV